MPLTTLAEFKIQRLEILRPDGTVDAGLDPKIPDAELLDLFRKMVELRAFDEKAFKLQRQGRLGTYPQVLGQEASQTVPPSCLKPKDWLLPTYRGQGCYFARGMEFKYSLIYWGGSDLGTTFPPENNDMIFAIPVGSHLTQAAGLAWACKLRKDPSVVMAYLGDGTSSKGDFHEGLTFAGVYKLPLIYVVENNHWAISVPRREQTAAQTFAQKAFGYGAAGIQVDGNDVLALHRATSEAIARARAGEGPTVIEAETYRLGDHTTADDAARYRPAEEMAAWKAKDPIARLEKHLLSTGRLSEAKAEAIRGAAAAKVQAAIEAYEATPEPDPMDIFRNMYAKDPPRLEQQREEFRRWIESRTHSGAEVFAEGRFP